LPAYKYTGHYDRFYGGVNVKTGDVAELDSMPLDGMWVPVEDTPENSPAAVPETAAEPVSQAPAPNGAPVPEVAPATVSAPVQGAPPFTSDTQPPLVVH